MGQNLTRVHGKGDLADRRSFELCHIVKSSGQNSENLSLFPASCSLGTDSQNQVILLLREA